MKPPPILLLSTLIVSLLLLILTGVHRTSGQDKNKDSKQAQTQEKDFSGFPIADLNNSETSNNNSDDVRGRKYNKKYLGQISEDTNQVFSNEDWDVGLPALPVERSAAIVIGTVINAKAHLTPDKSGIFSEFKIDVEYVAKEDAKNNISNKKTLIVERNGGRVKFPSGKLVVSWVNHQSMPLVGRKYVFFLTHDFQSQNDGGNDFNILTGYEIKDGRVVALDDTAPGHPISKYSGTAESKLISDLATKLAESANSSN